MQDHYYRTLLENDAGAFFQSHTTKTEREKLVAKICARLHRYPRSSEEGEGNRDPEDPWHSRIRRFISLILEESRYSIAEALHKRWGPSSRNNNYLDGIQVRIEFEDEVGRIPAVRRGIFYEEDLLQARSRFHRRIRYDLMRPGTIVELVPVQKGYVNVGQVQLGILSHQVWKGKVMHREKKEIILYNKRGKAENGLYSIHPLTSLLSYARQIVACRVLNPRLYPALMGDANAHVDGADNAKSPSPGKRDLIRRRLLANSGKGRDCSIEDMVDNPLPKFEDGKEIASASASAATIASRRSFTIPQMNDCQQKASIAFLSSPRGTIELVQGPPGTGKTTLLTATICRFLVERSAAGITQPRLMVCAPSNKAVTVLAARYLEAENTKHSAFRAAMVGDRDKMLSEDRLRFKDIFVYDWLLNMIGELRRLCQGVSWRNRTQRRSEVEALSKRLFENIPDHALRSERGSRALIKAILDNMDKDHPAPRQLDKAVQNLAEQLQRNEREIQSEMLGRANVIFCTLSSAGASIVKYTESVEGLIIDEAAAAIEPETYIPMALRPERIMIVGDPKQLPATILSQHARALSKSLQERLMFDERRPYTMLNVQYRMKPEISKFPSTTFYDGRLSDGPNVICPSYQSPVHCALLQNQPYSFIQVDGMERQVSTGSFENILEADMVVSLLQDVRTRARRDPRWAAIGKIRVITFYSAQVDLISKRAATCGLQQIAVSTVDSSQGSEADLIVISFVRTGKAGTIGFLSDDRRLNVAITRAKHKLICVGNAAQLAHAQGPKAAVVRSLVKDVQTRGNLHSTYCPLKSVVRARPVHNPFWKKRPQTNTQVNRKAKRRKKS